MSAALALLRRGASSRLQRTALAGAGAAGLAWWADESYGHRVGQRTLRALGTGALLLWEYKVRWTPETSSEVHARVARSVVACLMGNEGLYVKFGQVLMSMDMVLPKEYKTELRVLHDRAATFSFADVKKVVEADLGRPLNEVFQDFEEEPIASASVAQVHRARLRASGTVAAGAGTDGVEVAVKVQKPNIPVQNGWDLAVYRLVLEVLERAFELPLAWTYEYTRRQLEAELDFRVEAANAERCARELEASPRLRGRVAVPGVFREASGQRVLVMEWVDCIAPVNDGAKLKQAGVDPAEAMRVAVEVFGYQIFSTGHVHCDPHPGNLLVRRAAEGPQGWQLVLLDHGLYCELPEKLRRDYADFWVATTLGDSSAAIRLCSSWGVADAEASELLASLTQFRRVRFGAGRLGAVAGLFGRSRLQAQAHAPSQPRRKMTPEEHAAAQAAFKARAKKVLGDTRSFPQELLFVGRNMNIVRSANFTLGTVVNRVAVLARCAAEGAAVTGSAAGGGSFTTREWVSRSAALCKFHFVIQSLLLVDQLATAWHGLRLQLLLLGSGLGRAWASARPLLLGTGGRLGADGPAASAA